MGKKSDPSMFFTFPGKDKDGNYIPNPFQEQLDYFRAKLNLPTDRWDDVLGAAHDRAFIVAGMTKADMLQDMRDAVDKAIAQGTGLDAFRKDFAQIVQRTGWDYNGSFDWRSRVIYQTNLSTSYAAGRWAQLNDPDLLKIRPYWKYVHSDSVATPRPLHLSWHGTILPAGNAWWRTHFCPNGWGCQCRIVAASKREYDAAPDDRKQAPEDGTWIKVDAFGAEHVVPNGIDYGFAHAPGANAGKTFSGLIQEKLIRWDARIGADAFDELREAITPALSEEFASWADGITQPAGQVRVVGALSPKVVSRLSDAGLAPQSAHLAVRDQDVLHTHRDSKTDALPWRWYRELPAHLAKPQAVLLDKSRPEVPALIYVFDVGGATGKVVARLDYSVAVRDEAGKKAATPFNILLTGKTVPFEALLDRTAYELLEGVLEE